MCLRDGARSENLGAGGRVVIGGQNLPPLVEIGMTELLGAVHKLCRLGRRGKGIKNRLFLDEIVYGRPLSTPSESKSLRGLLVGK